MHCGNRVRGAEVTPEQKQRGVDLAEQVLAWSLFEGPGDMTKGELRQHIVAIFGAEVDAALAEKFARATIPTDDAP